MLKQSRATGESTDMHGLTLVEIVVVVAIAAILLAVAIPSYQRYLQRGQRADAIRSLMEVRAARNGYARNTGFTTPAVVSAMREPVSTGSGLNRPHSHSHSSTGLSPAP